MKKKFMVFSGFKLGMVAILVFFTSSFLPEDVINTLNIIVGVLLAYWGVSQFSPKLCFCVAGKKGKLS